MRKEEGSWKTHQVEKSTVRCFGSSHEKEGNSGWQSPENAVHVDRGFRNLGFWYLGFWTPRFRPKDVSK
jgi:hypothetical protein